MHCTQTLLLPFTNMSNKYLTGDFITCPYSNMLVLAALIFTLFRLNDGNEVQLTDCDCGVPNEVLDDRIVSGKATTPHEYPWVINIYFKGSLRCGGALINDRYIISAGHCIKRKDANDLQINLGMYNREAKDAVTVARIDKLILHPNYTSDFLHDTNDLSLIKLKEPVTFTEYVKPVCLPNPESDYSNRQGLVVGWGRTGQNQKPADILQQAEVDIMTFDECLNSSVRNHLANGMLCAYKKDKDACQGDSGGPLLYKRTPMKVELAGVVSWGVGCAREGVPGVYTKISDYIDWILENTKDAVYCSKN